MKKNYCLFFGALLTTSLVAQPVTNAPPAGPAETAAADTNAPAAKGEKKKAAKKAADKKSAPKKKSAGAELRTVPLIAGPAVVIASNVNVRGQAKLNSEVVTRVNKGQPVMVLEEVTLKNSGPNEPSAWAKIVLPTNAHPWVSAMYVTNDTVVPRKLQLRAGPGEEYSVLGTLKKGDTVKQVSTKGNWIQIEAPADAYAFVAAQYLKQEAPGTVATTAEAPATVPVTEPAPALAPVTEPAVATPPATDPATTPATKQPAS